MLYICIKFLYIINNSKLFSVSSGWSLKEMGLGGGEQGELVSLLSSE